MTTAELLSQQPHVLCFGQQQFTADNAKEFDLLLHALFAFAADRRALYAELMLTTSSTCEEMTAYCSEEMTVEGSYLIAALSRIQELYGAIYDPDNEFMKIHYSVSGESHVQ